MSSDCICVPGVHVALPDGRHAWEVPASSVSDLSELAAAAAAQVLLEATVVIGISHSPVPADGALTTTLVQHVGGASVQVHAKVSSNATDNITPAGFALLFEAVVSSGELVPAPVVPATHESTRSSSPIEELPEINESFSGRWDPNGTQTLEDRLVIVVSESMGYAPEDIPAEIPLIELGLDSLMAVRIKNRVEYEFDIPQLQLAVVKDASLQEVAKYLRYAVENREEVQAIADQQKAEQKAAEDEVAAVNPADAPTAIREAPPTDPEIDVPPRDAAERLTFATWAVVTGVSAKSIFAALPVLDHETAQKLAIRLTARAGGEITVNDVLSAKTIERLAEVVRQHLEDGVKIDGLVRTLRPREEGSNTVPVFVFHPAGGSTVAYEPLLKRLPADTPMYGLERTEGPLDERAKVYVPLLREIQGNGPYVLYGWSFGGALAYAVAKQLRRENADVHVVGLIDTVMPGEKVENTREEIRNRWQRYSAFAKKTYNVDAPLPYDQLAAAERDEEQIEILMDLLKVSGAKIPSGILKHQRTSWLDNRAIANIDLGTYDGAVVLYMADTYLDDQIALEPAFRIRQPDGGWGEAVENLEVIRIGCDHIQIVDEPYIAKVAADLSRKLAAAESREAART